MLRAIWTVEAQFRRFQKETALAARLETILVIFGLTMQLFSAFVLRIFFPKVQLKNNVLSSLAEVISRRSNAHSVTLFLVITCLLQVYTENEQVGHKEITNVKFKEKKSIKKLNAASQVYAERVEDIKEMPGPECNKGRCALRSRPHPAKLPSCASKRIFSS